MFGAAKKDTNSSTFSFGNISAPSGEAAFSFGLSGKTTDKKAEAAQNTFSFGGVAASSGFSFGNDKAITSETSKSEKSFNSGLGPQNSLKETVAPAPSAPGSSFNFGATPQADSNASAQSFSFGSTSFGKKKDSEGLSKVTTTSISQSSSFGAATKNSSSTSQEKNIGAALTSATTGGLSFGPKKSANQESTASSKDSKNIFSNVSGSPTTDLKISTTPKTGFTFEAASAKDTRTIATAGGAGSSFSASVSTANSTGKIQGAESKASSVGNILSGGNSKAVVTGKETVVAAGEIGFSSKTVTTPNESNGTLSATTPATRTITPKPIETPNAGMVNKLNTANRTISTTTPNIPKLEYQTLTVEQILNKFQGELERDTVEYLKESKRVAQYDAILRDSQRSLSALSQKTSTLLLQQTELEGMLNSIGSFHIEFENNLDQLESQVDQLFGAQAHLLPSDADMQRENAYATAVQCDQRLESLTLSVRDALDKLEVEGDDEFANILKILHQHQMQLTDLEHASRVMEHDINQLNISLNQ